MATKNGDGTTKTTRTRFTRQGDRFKVWRQVASSAALTIPAFWRS